MFWHDLTQAHQRLNGCVVMYDNKPIKFGSIEGREVRVKDLETGLNFVVSLEDPKFNNFRELPKLGFVNVPGRLYWLTRVPARSVTHGHTRGNVQVFHIEQGQMYRSDNSYEHLITYYGKYYTDSVNGRFPNWKEALSHAQTTQPIAIHHEFALIRGNDGGVQLWKNKRHVGSVSEKGIYLGSATLYLREELQQRLGIQEVMEA